jgi:hypothetical protein
MFRSYDHLHAEIYTLEINMADLNLGVCILLRVLDQVQRFPSNATGCTQASLTRYCFLFKCLGLEFVVFSLWGTLSDERPGLSFVSHSLVICLCVHLPFTVCHSHLYNIYMYIYI